VVDSGFSANEASMWLEGLFYYLDEPAVNHVLREISGLAAPNSLLVTELVRGSLSLAPGCNTYSKPWRSRAWVGGFGADDPAGLFAKYGWEAETKEPGVEGAMLIQDTFQTRRVAGEAFSLWHGEPQYAGPILRTIPIRLRVLI